MSLSPTRIRLLLRLASSLLLIGAVAVLVWATRAIPEQAPKVDQGAFNMAGKAPLIGSPSLDDFAQVWDKRLRRPLVDPPPKTEPPAKEKRKQRRQATPRARPDLQLVGTLIEGDQSVAILMDAEGELAFCRVGESIAAGGRNLRVEQIRSTAIELQIDGDVVQLALDSGEERPRP